jgi:WD40 repeat protein/transcriptional regulator with XRE-family HTH domain
MDRIPHYEQDYAFGQQMLTLRTAIGLTQTGLADYLGVSRRAIGDWEAGNNYPKPDHLKHFIELVVNQRAFTPGHEQERIRELWRAAHAKVLLDEAWLASLLQRSESQPQQHPTQPATQDNASTIGSNALSRNLTATPRTSWGNPLTIPNFYGRAWETAMLTQWVVEEGCRMVSVLGIGGIGKSALAVNLMHQVATNFGVVIWRSVRDVPSCEGLIEECLQVLAPEALADLREVGEGQTSTSLDRHINLLLKQLYGTRTLLVLDNVESLLDEGERTGHMRVGYEGYGRLLRRIAESEHQSCLLLTSREKPEDLASLEGRTSPVRALRLSRLGAKACAQLLAEKGVEGTEPEQARLIEQYAGNPLALKIVAQTIVDLFDGDAGEFQKEGQVIYGGVRDLLAEQFNRLSAVQQSIMYWLAILREPSTLDEIESHMYVPVPRVWLLDGIEALHRHSLVESGGEGGSGASKRGSFTLQSVVLEYVSDRLITLFAREFEVGQPELLNQYAILLATGRDYMRQSQERLIGQPILQRLAASSGADGAETRLLSLLERWRGKPQAEQGYGPGNVVNLLRLLRGDLRGMDLSGLFIRQVYLQEVDAQDVSLADSHLAECALADAFDFCLPVAFSPDGRYLAAGTISGEVCVWQLADRARIVSTQGHIGAVHRIDWASDGGLLATSGFDGLVKLWEPKTGQLLTTLEGHIGLVRDVCFSKDGHLVASGSWDATVKLWETSTGRLLHTLQGHAAGVWGVALSNNGSMVASASADGTVKLWDTASGSILSTLEGHSGFVHDVAFTPDGQLVASAGQDGVIRLWEVETGHLVATLEGHTQLIWHIAVSTDGQLLVSGSNDGTVRLWDIAQAPRVPSAGGVCLAVLKGHDGAILDVAISFDARLIASAGQDGTLRLWEVPSGRPVATLQGYARGAWALAWDGSGKLLANGTQAGTINLWDMPAGALRAKLRGHTGMVFGTALSQNGELLATGSFDYTIRFWRIADGHCLRTLLAHEGLVASVVLSPDARLLISGGADGWIKLWDATQSVASEEPLSAIQAHTGFIWQIGLSGDGNLLASASQDGTVKLWEIPSGQLLATMSDHDDLFWGVAVSRDGTLVASGGHSGRVTLWEAPSGRFLATLGAHERQAWSIAFSHDQRLLVSGGVDGAVMLWDVAESRLISRLTGHDGPVNNVAVSPDGSLIASSGQDGAVMLWDPASGAWRATLRLDRRYERMDISGLAGVSEVQRTVLQVLGAAEAKMTGPSNRSKVAEGR